MERPPKMKISLIPNTVFIEFIGFVKNLDRKEEKVIKNAFLFDLFERTFVRILRVIIAYNRYKSRKQEKTFDFNKNIFCWQY